MWEDNGISFKAMKRGKFNNIVCKTKKRLSGDLFCSKI